jgi:tRNA(fMet)-specific endonuclease VapC
MYLLDTDTIIYTLKGHEAVRKNLVQHRNDILYVSFISLMELYYGAYKSAQVQSNLAKIKTIESELNIIGMGAEVAQLFGNLKADLEKSGARLDDFDIVIAATALSHNFVLVTNNLRHFKRIDGLRLENWV